MKRVYLISLLVLMIVGTSCAPTRVWTKTEKVMVGTMVVGQAVDVWQTSKFIDNERGLREANPIMKNMGSVVAVKVVGGGLVIWLADQLPNQRKMLLGIGNFFGWGAVVWNWNELKDN